MTKAEAQKVGRAYLERYDRTGIWSMYCVRRMSDGSYERHVIEPPATSCVHLWRNGRG